MFWTVHKQGFHWWSLLWGLVCHVGTCWWLWTALTGSVLCLRSGPNRMGSFVDRRWVLWLAVPSLSRPQPASALGGLPNRHRHHLRANPPATPRHANPSYATPRHAILCHAKPCGALPRQCCGGGGGVGVRVWRVVWWVRCWWCSTVAGLADCVREAGMCSALNSDICMYIYRPCV